MKHVGRFKNTRRRVVVAYRTLPNDPYNALVVMTESLPASEHDDLMKLVESAAGQEEFELATAMARSYLMDGRQMLQAFHLTGMLRKVATNEIEMVPDSVNTIGLDQLNEIIAQQRGVTIADLAIQGDDPTPAEPAPQKVEATDQAAAYTDPAPVAETTTQVDDGVLSDEAMAAQLRSQADAMFKEAKRLREQAEELVPTKRKTTKKTAEVATE